MPAGEPRVSVIVPSFNRLTFLRPALESVLAQSERDWELLVADDGSDAETVGYLDSLSDARISVIRLLHSGNPSRVRNAAIARARGRYTAFLDSDDLWMPDKLAHQLQALHAAPDCRWSYTAIEKIDGAGQRLPGAWRGPRPGGWIFPALLRLEIGIAMPTVMVDTRLLQDIGGFDEGQAHAEFHDLCLRLALRAPVVSLSEPLAAVRFHGEHYSADREADQQGWLRLYAKMAGLPLAPDLQRHCRRARAETSLRLAAAQAAAGRGLAAIATLAGALGVAWRYPAWWRGVARGAWHALRR